MTVTLTAPTPVRLALLERRVARAQTVEEAITLRDDVKRLRDLAQQVGASLHEQNHLALVGLLAEHRAGTLLSRLPRTPGARTDLEPGASVAAGSTPYQRAVKTCRIKERTAERWQALARTHTPEDLGRRCEQASVAGLEFTRARVHERVEAPGGNVWYNAPTRVAHAAINWLRIGPRRLVVRVEFGRLQDYERFWGLLGKRRARGDPAPLLLRLLEEDDARHNGGAA